VSPSPGAGAGATGADGLAVGDCVVVVVSSTDVVVVVVLSEPASSFPQPVASEPAATPAASANRAEFERTLRVVMSPVVTRQNDS
jgi:hypothetical protein